MFKISFKEGTKKVQLFNDRITVVTLTGTMKLPKRFWSMMPYDISDWILYHPTVEFNDSLFEASITVLGKSVCANEDIFDPVLGERIAESRAKIRLYRFMHTLMYKLYKYHFGMALGDKYSSRVEVEDKTKNGGIFEVMGKYQGLLIKESHHLGELLAEV